MSRHGPYAALPIEVPPVLEREVVQGLQEMYSDEEDVREVRATLSKYTIFLNKCKKFAHVAHYSTLLVLSAHTCTPSHVHLHATGSSRGPLSECGGIWAANLDMIDRFADLALEEARGRNSRVVQENKQRAGSSSDGFAPSHRVSSSKRGKAAGESCRTKSKKAPKRNTTEAKNMPQRKPTARAKKRPRADEARDRPHVELRCLTRRSARLRLTKRSARITVPTIWEREGNRARKIAANGR